MGNRRRPALRSCQGQGIIGRHETQQDGPTRKPTTLCAYRIAVDHHLIPGIGPVELPPHAFEVCASTFSRLPRVRLALPSRARARRWHHMNGGERDQKLDHARIRRTQGAKRRAAARAVVSVRPC
ncbi:hypothetical protein GCM10027053_15750 [Intrasporangium mesophilum]